MVADDIKCVKRKFPASNSGSEEVPEYSSRLRKDGSVEVYVSGVRNIQSEIQSHAESVDITNILRRYALGDVSVLSKTQGVYGDFLNAPATYAEVLQKVIDAENLFGSLPLDVRERFGNDFKRFFASTGSDEWLRALGWVRADSPEPVPSEEEKSAEAERG